MNGRVYDPKLGRFMSADPNIQAPTDTQSLNRYSYVLNNPLSATDPSGYFFKKLKKYWRTIVSIAVMFIPVGNVMLLGAISGYISTGSLKGALIGAFTAGVGGGTAANLEGFLTSSLVGGITSVANGGKFGRGFVSAGFSSFAGGAIGKIQNVVGRVITRGIIGGTISKLTGGKFGNGAATSAFSQALSEAKVARGQAEPANEETRDEGDINITGHKIGKVGPIHTAVEGPGEFDVETLSSGNENGNLSGGAEGVVESGVDRPSDHQDKNFTIGKVTPPKGMTSKQYFAVLREANTFYQKNFGKSFDYDLFPGIQDSHNSNSYIRGLIDATGGTYNVDLGRYFGGNDPVPAKYFGY